MNALVRNNEIVKDRIKFYSDKIRDEFRKRKELRDWRSLMRWRKRRDKLTEW